MSAGTWLTLLLPVLALGYAVARVEAARYAAAHPDSRLVRDGKVVVAEAQAVARALGVTPAGAAQVVAGYLTDHGLPATGSAVLAAAGAVGTQAKADEAALAPAK